MEDKIVITDEEVENYIKTATIEYDEEKDLTPSSKTFELKDLDGNVLEQIKFSGEDYGTMRIYKFAKLSDYPNLTEQELGFFRLKNVRDYNDLKEQVRNLLYEERKNSNNKNLADNESTKTEESVESEQYDQLTNNKIEKLIKQLSKYIEEDNQEKIAEIQKELEEAYYEEIQKQVNKEVKKAKQEREITIKQNDQIINNNNYIKTYDDVKKLDEKIKQDFNNMIASINEKIKQLEEQEKAEKEQGKNEKFESGEKQKETQVNNNSEIVPIVPIIKDLSFEELVLLKKNKIQQCQDKINGKNLNDYEKENLGYLLFNAKMILRSIILIDDNLLTKFEEKLDAKEKEILTKQKYIILDNLISCNSLENVSAILKLIMDKD